MDHTKHYQRSESGQIIILLVFAIISLLAITGLAIDGGRVFSDRREAQNVADTASLTAALADCNNVNAAAAALDRAATNGFDNDGITNTVVVNNPPASGSYAGDSDYFEVVITTVTRPTFIQLVYRGPLENTVRAVARCKPPGGIAFGNAIVSLDPSACSSLEVTGGGSIQTIGGGIFVNSNANAKNCHAAVVSGGGSVDGGPDGIQVVGGTQTNGGGSFSPPLTTGVPPLDDPLANLPPPSSACAGPAVNYKLNGGKTAAINPGHYSGIDLSGGSSLTLNPGIYCIDSPQVNQGLTVSGGSNIQGTGVLLYFKNGSFSASGGGTVDLSAPTDANCVGLTCDYVGLLVYSDHNNSNKNADFHMSGGSGTSFTGTIYAPNNDCIVTGNALDVGLNSQVICKTVNVSGTGTFVVNYDQDLNVKTEGTIDLYE